MNEQVRKNTRRLRRRGFFASPRGHVVRTTVHGTPIFFTVVNARDEIQKYHMQGKFYEEEELAILGRHFPVGGRFLDVGANIGNHSVYVARFLHASRIVLIEPNPDAIVVLESNILLNGLEGVCDRGHLGIGLSDAVATGSIHAPKRNIGYARVTEGEGDIPLATADALLGQEAFDLVKIDVEGMEIRVLTGMEGLIVATRPKIFIEVDNANSDAFTAWCAQHSYNVAERFQRYEANENYLVVPT